jgi:hypothetical protein
LSFLGFNLIGLGTRRSAVDSEDSWTVLKLLEGLMERGTSGLFVIAFVSFQSNFRQKLRSRCVNSPFNTPTTAWLDLPVYCERKIGEGCYCIIKSAPLRLYLLILSPS